MIRKFVYNNPLATHFLRITCAPYIRTRLLRGGHGHGRSWEKARDPQKVVEDGELTWDRYERDAHPFGKKEHCGPFYQDNNWIHPTWKTPSGSTTPGKVSTVTRDRYL